jgi:hypothetical protein
MMMVCGVALVLFGAIAAIFNVGPSVDVSTTIPYGHLSTHSFGVAMMIAGGLIIWVSLRLPDWVSRLIPPSPPPPDQTSSPAPPPEQALGVLQIIGRWMEDHPVAAVVMGTGATVAFVVLEAPVAPVGAILWIGSVYSYTRSKRNPKA